MENLSSVKKYEFTGETKVIEDFYGQTRLLRRIRAICDFGRIKKANLADGLKMKKIYLMTVNHRFGEMLKYMGMLGFLIRL